MHSIPEKGQLKRRGERKRERGREREREGGRERERGRKRKRDDAPSESFPFFLPRSFPSAFAAPAGRARPSPAAANRIPGGTGARRPQAQGRRRRVPPVMSPFSRFRSPASPLPRHCSLSCSRGVSQRSALPARLFSTCALSHTHTHTLSPSDPLPPSPFDSETARPKQTTPAVSPLIPERGGRRAGTSRRMRATRQGRGKGGKRGARRQRRRKRRRRCLQRVSFLTTDFPFPPCSFLPLSPTPLPHL